MKTIYAAKLGIALGVWFCVGLVLPFGGGFFAEPFVWMLVGNFWQVLFVYDTLSTFAFVGPIYLYAPDFMDGVTLHTELVPIAYFPSLVYLFAALGAVAVLLVMSSIGVKLLGPWLERKAQNYLGYMPRKL